MNNIDNDYQADTNAYQAPEAEDDIRPLVAENPLAHQRASALALLLWSGWLMLVLGVIVWFVG